MITNGHSTQSMEKGLIALLPSQSLTQWNDLKLHFLYQTVDKRQVLWLHVILVITWILVKNHKNRYKVVRSTACIKTTSAARSDRVEWWQLLVQTHHVVNSASDWSLTEDTRLWLADTILAHNMCICFHRVQMDFISKNCLFFLWKAMTSHIIMRQDLLMSVTIHNLWFIWGTQYSLFIMMLCNTYYDIYIVENI